MVFALPKHKGRGAWFWVCALLVVMWLAAPGSSRAGEVVERPDLATVFEEIGVEGTFVLLDAQTGRTTVVNPGRAAERFFPASTFKIPNSLLALDTGAVADEAEIIPYGGAPQRIRAWERDMSMREAIRVSNVAIYRELARRIGDRAYAAFFESVPYGNGAFGSVDQPFWLTGPLKISALEQAEFLAELATGRLPVSRRAQRVVRGMIRQESRGGARLYGKTGWANGPDPDIGWFVGWVDRGGEVFAFALNMEIRSRADADRRIAIARDLLAALGVYGAP